VTIGTTRLSLTDAIGATVSLLIAGGGYLLLIRGPLRESGRLDVVHEASRRADAELSTMRAETGRLRHEIEGSTKTLAAFGGGLPEARDIDRYLAQVMAAATASGITIDTVSPLPTTEQDDHEEIHVSFAARGPFVGFHRMLRAIEHDLEYADITHFSVASGSEGSESSCRLNWSLRICTSRSGPIARTVLHANSP
jgi:Tfp pilus assembly protein PilO